MQGTIKTVVYVGLAWVGYKFFNKMMAAKRLSFSVRGISVHFSGITPYMDVKIGVANPSNETLHVGSIVGDMYMNGNYVSSISAYGLTEIKGLGESVVPVTAKLSLTGVAAEIQDIVKGIIDKQPLQTILSKTELKFKGYINAEGTTIPMDFSYKIL